LAHYLLAVSPIRGHVIPMLDIGAGLQALGHDVVVVTGGEFTDEVRTAGLRLIELADEVSISPPPRLPAMVRRLPDQARRFWLGRTELDAVFIKPLAAEAASVCSAIRQGTVDAILADVAFTGVLPLLLRDEPRPPIVVCGVGPLTLSSADTPPFGMAWQPVPGTDYRPMTAVAHRVIMRSSQGRLNRALGHLGVRRAPVFISDWPRLADGMVQLAVAEFEYPRGDLPSTVEFVGPVPAGASTAAFELPNWWTDVLAADTVVHVTQGTFDNTDPDHLITPALQALGARGDMLLVVTTGRPDNQLLKQIPDNARVAQWLPYSALMPHVDVMISNGGYGGVQYALSHGVPLVVAGETSDKAEVAARVDYTGVGIDVGTATPTAAQLRDAVDRVLGDDAYRSAAQRMRHAIAATTPVDSIANALKRLGESTGAGAA
jgi:UDP:flavonoid glycosyltransferase YjiC (YdhE family)